MLINAILAGCTVGCFWYAGYSMILIKENKKLQEKNLRLLKLLDQKKVQ